VNDERAYRALVERIRALLAERVPEGARVLVATRGDESLLRVPGRDARHFPQSPTGLYAGHYPAGGDEAVRHLDTLRERGADYLALPSTARWWLDHYPELSQRLEDEGELVADEPDTCVLFALEREEDARVRLVGHQLPFVFEALAELWIVVEPPAGGAREGQVVSAPLPEGVQVPDCLVATRRVVAGVQAGGRLGEVAGVPPRDPQQALVAARGHENPRALRDPLGEQRPDPLNQGPVGPLVVHGRARAGGSSARAYTTQLSSRATSV